MRWAVLPIPLTFARKAIRKAAIWSWLPLLRSSCEPLTASQALHLDSSCEQTGPARTVSAPAVCSSDKSRLLNSSSSTCGASRRLHVTQRCGSYWCRWEEGGGGMVGMNLTDV